MTRDKLLGVGNVGGLILGGLMVTEWANVIYLVVGIISFLISIACGIVKLYFTIKKAKADGVITPEEAQEIIDRANEIKQQIKKEDAIHE